MSGNKRSCRFCLLLRPSPHRDSIHYCPLLATPPPFPLEDSTRTPLDLSSDQSARQFAPPSSRSNRRLNSPLFPSFPPLLLPRIEYSIHHPPAQSINQSSSTTTSCSSPSPSTTSSPILPALSFQFTPNSTSSLFIFPFCP